MNKFNFKFTLYIEEYNDNGKYYVATCEELPWFVVDWPTIDELKKIVENTIVDFYLERLKFLRSKNSALYEQEMKKLTKEVVTREDVMKLIAYRMIFDGALSESNHNLKPNVTKSI